MKLHLYRYILLPASFLLFFTACHKVDEHIRLIDNQPSLATGEIDNINKFGIGNYIFNTSYFVGDTAILIGRLFPDRPGTSIQIGAAAAVIVRKEQIVLGGLTLDVVWLPITRSMGIGSSIPVTINANGISMQGPFFSIHDFAAAKGRTDTTLYVSQLGAWLPANVAVYQAKRISLLNCSNVSGSGDLYFDNALGVFAVKNQQVTPVLSAGDQLTENGVGFTINHIEGSVISFDGNTLNFSAEVLENTPDTASFYIFRLSAMNLATRAVKTLNRTVVHKGMPSVAGYMENASPYEGGIGGIKILAEDPIRTDVIGDPFFFNHFFPFSSRLNSNHHIQSYSLFFF